VPEGDFPTVIVGSHNPDVTVYPITRVTGAQSFFPFSLPYHTTKVTSDEILQDAWDNRDDQTPEPDCSDQLKLTILDFGLDPGDPTTFNQFYGQTIEGDPFNSCAPSMTGTPFNLVPGNGYTFQVIADGTQLPIPHY
jgi:hypothetical protein